MDGFVFVGWVFFNYYFVCCLIFAWEFSLQNYRSQFRLVRLFQSNLKNRCHKPETRFEFVDCRLEQNRDRCHMAQISATDSKPYFSNRISFNRNIHRCIYQIQSVDLLVMIVIDSAVSLFSSVQASTTVVFEMKYLPNPKRQSSLSPSSLKKKKKIFF